MLKTMSIGKSAAKCLGDKVNVQRLGESRLLNVGRTTQEQEITVGSLISVPPKEEVLGEYLRTLSAIKVADKFNVSKKTALKWMKGYGIERFTRSYLKCLRKPLLRYIKEGRLTTKEVAMNLGVTDTTVKNMAKKLGYKKPFDTFHKGYKITDSGYVLIRQVAHPQASKEGYVRQHRLVMEDYLCRYLEDGEVVHHLDHNKSNNVIRNLELCTDYAHKSYHSRTVDRSLWKRRGSVKDIV